MDALKLTKSAVDSTKQTVVKVYEKMKAPTPRWAKICRNAGIVLTAVGTGVIAAPAIFPAAIVSAGAYLVFGGTVATAIFQGFKKTE